MANGYLLSGTITMQPITPEKARSKALKFCAYQERSQQEMRDKIYSWGLHQREVESIISYLIEEGFLKEERFRYRICRRKIQGQKMGKESRSNSHLKTKKSPSRLSKKRSEKFLILITEKCF
jgi:regulatory protein